MLKRDATNERVIAEAWAAIERGDIERARRIVREIPERQRRQAAHALVQRRNHTSALVPGDPELVLDLFDQAHMAAVTRIDDYVQGPALIERTRSSSPGAD